MPKNEYVEFPHEHFARLRAAVIVDVQRHVASLRDANVEFYAYAGHLPDYFRANDAAYLTVAYNCESDLSAEHREDIFYRYAVDEWKHCWAENLKSTHEILESLLPHFEASRKMPDDGDTLQDLIHAVFATILDAFRSLRKDGTFKGVRYVALWLSDSQHDIIKHSVKELNTPEVYAEYASEFEGY